MGALPTWRCAGGLWAWGGAALVALAVPELGPCRGTQSPSPPLPAVSSSHPFPAPLSSTCCY